MMRNMEVAWAFSETANLMEIAGEDGFRSRAYRQAARAIADLDEDIEELSAQGRLREIPGIGRELEKKINQLLATGSFPAYDRLREKVPPGLVAMLELPGLGVKSVRLIYEQLGITTLDELEAAARRRQIRELPGLGSKTELGILRGIEMLRSRGGRVPLGLAQPLGEELIGFLNSLPPVAGAALAGSVRRGCDLVGDVDLVAAAADEEAENVVQSFIRHPKVKDIIEIDSRRALIRSFLGVKVELVVVHPRDFLLTVFHNTGSRAHWEALEEFAASRDLKFTFPANLNSVVEFEKAIYSGLGLDYIAPELREGRGEIAAADCRRLPQLVRLEDVQGDLHLHTNWSDGVNNLEQLVAAAKACGYQYIAITEHSKSLAISRGLNEERLRSQVEEIKRLNRQEKEFHILTGIEVDILGNATLDLPDDLLAELDLVIASIHSGFRQEPERITERILAALENPHVDILAHPTGRMLARREPYAFDLERVFHTAVKTKTALEINASPDRLDLSAENARRFIELGGYLAINTDAHDIRRLDDMKYGVITARRGWVEADRVINTWPLAKLLHWLKQRD